MSTDRENLEREIAAINSRIESMQLWTLFSGTPTGKKAIEDQEKLLADIRSQYFTIDATKPDAVVKLAYCQGRETEAINILNTMKAPEETAKKLAEAAKILDIRYENMRSYEREKDGEALTRGGLFGKGREEKE